MPDYVTLLGAEDVRSAASTMQRAAHEMQVAASTIEHSLNRHADRMEEVVRRMETLAEEAKEHVS